MLWAYCDIPMCGKILLYFTCSVQYKNIVLNITLSTSRRPRSVIESERVPLGEG